MQMRHGNHDQQSGEQERSSKRSDAYAKESANWRGARREGETRIVGQPCIDPANGSPTFINYHPVVRCRQSGRIPKLMHLTTLERPLTFPAKARSIVLSRATSADRDLIGRLRHDVYACELAQYDENDSGCLHDRLEGHNVVLVARSEGSIQRFSFLCNSWRMRLRL